MATLFEDVQKAMIRQAYAEGTSQVQLAKKYGVSRATIQNYILGYSRKPKSQAEKRVEITMENWNEMAKASYDRLNKRAVTIHGNR